MTTQHPAYCDHFWGTHACDLPPGHDLDGPQEHQCWVMLHLDENGEPPVRLVCSEMRVMDGDGVALMRFHMTDGGWTDWVESTWFSIAQEVGSG